MTLHEDKSKLLMHKTKSAYNYTKLSLELPFSFYDNMTYAIKHLNGNLITPSESVQDLGVLMSPDSLFAGYINQICNKADST